MRELSIEEICSVSGGIQQGGGYDWRDIGVNSKNIKVNLGQVIDGMKEFMDKVAEMVVENADIPPSQITPREGCYSIPSVGGNNNLGSPLLPFKDLLGDGERIGDLSN